MIPRSLRPLWSLVALAVLTPLVAACSSIGADDASAGAKPEVVAAFYPFEFLADRVAGDNAVVSNLTTPGVEPHDMQLTPRQVAELSDADLVIYEAGFQPAVDTAIEQSPPREALEVVEVLSRPKTPTPAVHRTSTNTDALLEGDPHLWLDPTLLVPVTEQIADDLASAAPTHAEDFKANAASLIKDLLQLDREFTAGLESCERRDIVTSHAAFAYLANRYDLTMIPIAGLSPDVEPSPERLAEIQELIRSRNITTVFSETLGSKQYAETLVGDLGVSAAVLDPIEGLTDQASTDDDYLSLMRTNLTAMQEANDCQ
ncbi:MAG: zinc ABC transporter substrate-binding protein [Nocardioidaceae bacterium]|nr:zinc ABC transporter substrate-binding protein [Nocardioidaceae bacterium]